MSRHYLLVVALLSVGCYSGERYDATIQRQWPAGSVRTVELVEVDGNLTVQAGQSNEIQMTAHVRSRGIRPDRNRDNQGFFQSELNGDTLRIGQERKHVRVHFPFFNRQSLRVDYTLLVPPTVALDLKTVNGHISTRGVDGETVLTTVNGPIEIETAGRSEVSARTVNGAVRARFMQDFRGARLKTVNGAVEAMLPPSASFSCDLSQVNGDFEASFPLSIHSNPGSRRVSGSVNGGQYELRITTVNGDVEVQHLPAVPAVPAVPAPGAVPATPPKGATPAIPTPPQPPAPVT
jgi:DUF4097 and DUF4098 domain-containing protein YvlB